MKPIAKSDHNSGSVLWLYFLFLTGNLLKAGKYFTLGVLTGDVHKCFDQTNINLDSTFTVRL